MGREWQPDHDRASEALQKGKLAEMDRPYLPLGTHSFTLVMKGGGFEYVGAIIPTENFPQAYRDTLKIADKYRSKWSIMCRVIGRGHSMMFAYSWPFNRADEKDVGMAKKALHESNVLSLRNGAVIWKADLEGQRLMMKMMDPNTLRLLQKIKKTLDPNGIMNPGNWEAI